MQNIKCGASTHSCHMECVQASHCILDLVWLSPHENTLSDPARTAIHALPPERKFEGGEERDYHPPGLRTRGQTLRHWPFPNKRRPCQVFGASTGLPDSPSAAPRALRSESKSPQEPTTVLTYGDMVNLYLRLSCQTFVDGPGCIFEGFLDGSLCLLAGSRTKQRRENGCDRKVAKHSRNAPSKQDGNDLAELLTPRMSDLRGAGRIALVLLVLVPLFLFT